MVILERSIADQSHATICRGSSADNGSTSGNWAACLVVALVASLMSPAGVSAQQSQTSTVTLGGTISADGGMSVSGVMVTALHRSYRYKDTAGFSQSPQNSSTTRPWYFKDEDNFIGETSADASGRWSLTVTPPDTDGRIVLMFWDPLNKLAAATYHSISPDYSGDVVRWSNQNDISVKMKQGGFVTGKFTMDSKPLPDDARYLLFHYSDGIAYRLNVDLVSGEFISPAIAAGFYWVGYAGAGIIGMRVATTGEAVAGETINIGTVEVKKAGSLSGRVTDTSGRGVAGVLVMGIPARELFSAADEFSSSFGWHDIDWAAYEEWPDTWWADSSWWADSTFGVGANTKFAVFTESDGTYSVDGLYPMSDWQVRFADVSGNTLQFYDNQSNTAAADKINLIDPENPGYLSGLSVSGVDAEVATSGSLHWSSIAELWKRGIISVDDFDVSRFTDYGNLDLGCVDHPDNFCPSGAITRRDMAVWLIMALEGKSPPKVDVSRFADVRSYYWRRPFIERLAELGITKGCRLEPLSFCPDDPVTRSQMASFLVRAFKLPAAEQAAGFTDTDDVNAKADIDALAASRITAGCSTKPLKYCPGSHVTRAQMATFLARAIALRSN